MNAHKIYYENAAVGYALPASNRPENLREAVRAAEFDLRAPLHWPMTLTGVETGVWYADHFPTAMLGESIRFFPDLGGPCEMCTRHACTRPGISAKQQEMAATERRKCRGDFSAPIFYVDVDLTDYPAILRAECLAVAFDEERTLETDRRVARVAVYETDSLLNALVHDGRFAPMMTHSPFVQFSTARDAPLLKKHEPLARAHPELRDGRIVVGFYEGGYIRKEPPVVYTVVDNTCAVCLANKTCVAFVPCGHVCCDRCGDHLRGMCHVCRAPIERQLRLFF